MNISCRYTGRFDCGCKYALRATVHDGNDKLIEQHNYNDVLPQWEANIWTKVCTYSYFILYSIFDSKHSDKIIT